MPTLKVPLGSRSYRIVVGAGVLSGLGRLARPLARGRTAVVVTDGHVARYLKPALDSLADAGFTGSAVVLPPGERTKSPGMLETLWNEFAEARAGRDALVVALGGGVVGDLAGFAAATWNRGVDFIQVPTTLLAMVDASIGGKTGLNLRAGKNLAGAFHQPRLVLADTDTLKTLPDREYRAGLAEVVKYALIGDPALLRTLESETDFVLARAPRLLTRIVSRCASQKARIVSRDERESGERMLLNLGHTFGHAIEAATRYRRYLHGEAVAIGLCAAAVLSGDAGLAWRVKSVVKALGLPTAARGVDPDRLREIAGRDKKARGGEVRYVVPEGVGKCRVREGLPEARVAAAWGAAAGR